MLSAVCCGVLWLGVSFRPLEKYENMAVDYLFFLRGERKATPKKSQETPDAVVVALDPATLKKVGRWPWPRGVIARLLHHVCRGEPSTVALDVLLDRESTDYAPWFYRRDSSFDPRAQDNMLNHALRSCPAPVLAELYKFEGGRQQTLGPARPFQIKEASVGFVNLPQNALDQRVRKWRPVWKDEKTGHLKMAFALRAYLHHQRLGEKDVSLAGDRLRVGKITVPLDRNGEMWINWTAAPPQKETGEPVGVISAKTLLEETEPDMIAMVSAFLVQGKAVFIGLTDPEEKDMFNTPYALNPDLSPGWANIGGVRVHQQAMQTLLDGAFLRDQPVWLTVLFLAPAFFAVLLLFTRSMAGGLVSVPLLTMGVLVLAQQRFVSLALVMPMVTPAVTLMLSGAMGLVYRLLIVDREKRQTANLFKSYVAPHVLHELMKNPDDLGLSGKKSEVTVLFSDVRGFTTLSEKLDPAELVTALNIYLTRMTEIIFEHQGMVDKFIGDAIMAVWGAPTAGPQDREKALDAALGMVAALKELNPEIERHAGQPFAVGVGLNSGMVTLGNIGSKNKLDYTVIGDAVNLASRLESLTKQYGVQLLVSENIVEGLADKYHLRSLDLVIVKGKTRPIEIFEVLGKRG